MDWASTFGRLLSRHRRADGSEWTGADIERATGGRVSRFYISRLKRGIIEDPSFTKIHLISHTIGARLEEWVEEPSSAPHHHDRPHS